MKKLISSVAICAALGLTVLATQANAVTIKPNTTSVACWLSGSAMGNGYGESLTGTFAGGTGYYVNTLEYGDGTVNGSSSGSSTSYTWTHFYPGAGVYNALLTCGSGGFSDQSGAAVNF